MNNNFFENRIFGLDLMRAVAILMVLSSHLLWIYPKSNNILTQVCAMFGFWGVEIFFVLSGYLIGGILFRMYVDNEFTFQKLLLFLKRRWFRTLPNYFIILILNILIAYFLEYEIQNVGLYFVFIQNFASKPEAFFTESWSLSVEEWTYIILPFSLYFFNNFKKIQPINRYFSVLVLFIVLFTSNRIIYNSQNPITTMDIWNGSLKSVVLYRIDAILYGALAYCISIKFKNLWESNKNVLMYFGIILALFLFMGVGIFQITIQSSPFFWNVLYFPITSICFCLLLPVLSNWKNSNIKISKSITFISKISYSVYLLHYGIVLQLMKHFVNPENFSMPLKHIYTLTYLIITFTISYLWFRFYENPMTNLRDKL